MDTKFLRRLQSTKQLITLNDINCQQLRQKLATDTIHFAKAANMHLLSQIEEILIHLMLRYAAH